MVDVIADILKRSGNPDLGARDLERFNLAFRQRFGSDCDWTSSAARIILKIFGNSHALTERLIGNPDWASGYPNDPFLSKPKPREVMKAELEENLDGVDPSRFDEIGRLLRHFKYREMIRIVAKDLEGKTPVDELLREWSNLADTLISAAYKSVHIHFTKTYGPTCAGTIIALGKLGGRELNMSSDVDLLCLYEKDIRDVGESASITPHEFYVRLVNNMTQMLARVTEDGFVFRVDHDLRPEGQQGTLANSIEAAERYYQYFGQDWERQALIRAHPVAGDIELGKTFIENIRPFVFRRTLSLDDLKAMKRIKKRMSEETGKSKGTDIKLGDGGIRALEFLVQAMQLIYGGKIKSLQVSNTFEAIDALMDEHIIHGTSGKNLKNAYSFLRRTENMLQVIGEQQVHSLPSNKDDIHSLAKRMGYPDDDSGKAFERFSNDLKDHMSAIQRLFDGMFQHDYERTELIGAIESNIASCTNEEETYDSIPWFKHQEVRRIQHLDLEGKLSFPEVLSRLTLVSEIVISIARKLAWNALTERYGVPRSTDGARSQFAIVGMGKLGSEEVDYGSDLDLCFIYSAEGKTDGERSIDNAEFFARLAQRIISLITTMSRYGRAYEVDSALRPSGRSGTLVTTHEAFMDYHLSQAQAWERMALMRSRVIDGYDPFINQLSLTLDSLAFELPPPEKNSTVDELRHIRERVANELAQENDRRLNVKHGRGGSDDLDSAIQYLQLMNLPNRPSLRLRNTFKIIDAFRAEDILDEQTFTEIADHLNFYRVLLSRIRLFSGRSTTYLDIGSSHANTIARQMGFEDTDQLKNELLSHRAQVKELFDDILK